MAQTRCGAMEAGSIINGLPNICGHEESVVPDGPTPPPAVFAPCSDVDLARVRSAFALALHMHQPTIPAGTGDISTAPLIGHLQYMLEHPKDGDNHNAPVFARCYTRIADFVRTLCDAGHSPRIMLDYSGNLLWGLEQMGRGDILDNLRSITCDTRYNRHVEWLGTLWGHAVVPSTPVPDIIRHVRAWRHHFASIFGLQALQRVRGFSPPEMHLPNDPDVAYAFVDALMKCGYTWILVQEHSVENPDGSAVRHAHLPHRLVARNSSGEELSITALVKTQGSDTKLVAQMQPLAEAQTLDRMRLGEVSVPPLVTQIGDGENGGVMMNEFPAAYNSAMASLSREGVTALNGTEYLELIGAAGAKPADYLPIQPVLQHRLWQHYAGGGRRDLDRVIEKFKSKDQRFHMDGGSWTNNLSWVRGYENVLTPMQRLSVRFDQKVRQCRPDPDAHAYRNALLHLLCSQTSCFRYWGQGGWTDYAIEICRRGSAILDHDV
ncbi:MAG: hypothetical protein JSV19_06520 [Phycisphaerales bacterium]|nr:MAG: hypothetical protein JSV19_06520 [Phycisphaerales bacterium]